VVHGCAPVSVQMGKDEEEDAVAMGSIASSWVAVQNLHITGSLFARIGPRQGPARALRERGPAQYVDLCFTNSRPRRALFCALAVSARALARSVTGLSHRPASSYDYQSATGASQEVL